MKMKHKEILNKVLNKLQSDGLIEKWAKEHADNFKDLTEVEALIIRSHIIIEKELTKAISTLVYREDEFKPDKFTFSQKVVIARMLGISGLLKEEINILNKLRNQIAHTLQIDYKLVENLIINISKKDPDHKYLKSNMKDDLKRAISFMAGIIAIDPYYAKVSYAAKGIDYLNKMTSQISN